MQSDNGGVLCHVCVIFSIMISFSTFEVQKLEVLIDAHDDLP